MISVNTRPKHFYKYCTPDVAKIVLKNKTLRWNSPLKFNDPYDCYFSFEPKFEISELKRNYIEKYLELIFSEKEPSFHPKNPFGVFLSKCRKELRAIDRDILKEEAWKAFDEMVLDIEKNREELRKLWSEQANELRIMCVCEINDNPILWSHYSKNHEGVALQIECLEEVDSPFLMAQKVKYVDVPPDIHDKHELLDFVLGLRAPSNPKEIWEKHVLSKQKEWEYEKEWRVISGRRSYEFSGFEDCPFSSPEISNIFIGCRASEEDRREILDIIRINFPNAKVHQALQMPVSYKLHFERIF